MHAPSARMSVLVGEKFCCVKIVGRANVNSSVDFKALVQQLRQKGCNYFVLDLSECTLMDSTFLGMLAGFGMKMSDGDKCDEAMELLNPNTTITELLENLGVLQLFKVSYGPPVISKDAKMAPKEAATPGKEAVTRACLEAHRTLMDLNPENVSRFKDVTQVLSENLKSGRNK
jgi:anti-sigma B factor antagonist